ncbi:MAG TPA: hypothetical protein VFU81_16225 [Thermomicrobiales bacterium]|nr:hypothetical protein [Thermomicrobiales bacterium]
MRSVTTMRTAAQAILGIAVLGGVAAALFWAVMSFNSNNDDPNHPILSGTSIPAPTADDPQPAQPTPPPTSVAPTRESALALPTAADLPASVPTVPPAPPEVSVQAPQPAPAASGPTPSPRVMRAPAATATATAAASDGIAAEVIPTASSQSVQSARAWPTPAPLVDAPPPTSTPDFGAIVEATQPPRRSRQTPTPIGGRPTVEPAIVPLRDPPPTPRGAVVPGVPGVPTVIVPAVEPAQIVPTIVAIDTNPAKRKAGRGKTPGPIDVLPNGAIDPRGTRTPIVPGAPGVHRGVPGVTHPGKGPNKNPSQKNNGHNNNGNGNGNGNGNKNDNNKNKDKKNSH